MGDRFYTQQLAAGKGVKKGEIAKTPRKLKKDYILEVNTLLGSNIVGLEKLTIKTLIELVNAIGENK